MICTILMSTSNDMKPPILGPKGPKTPNKLHVPPQLLAWYIQYQCKHQLTYNPPTLGPEGPKTPNKLHIPPKLLAWYIQYQCKHQMLACLVPNGLFYTMVPNCPRCQIVPFSLWCQIVHGAKLSTVLNCPRCQIVHGAKLSTVPNCPRCQIVRSAKLSRDLSVEWNARQWMHKSTIVTEHFCQQSQHRKAHDLTEFGKPTYT